jgi:fucose permease
MNDRPSAVPVVPRGLLVPFVLVTLLFPLWGFANDITNPMVAGFKNILLLTNFQSSLVQAAFYGGYALMAIPAAIFIKRFSYKSGILIGLALYALGCLLFIPSGWTLTFAPFLLAYLVMTCGLSFLETTANPYVLSMGDPATATRRLNLAQAFNPLGSITGMFVASMFILVNLDSTSEAGRRLMKGVADGETVHRQVAVAQEKAAADLERLLGQPGWHKRKAGLKKAAEQSEALRGRLALLADPRAGRAVELSGRLSAQPAQDKFAAAVQAVAVVIQVRERPAPTPAEAERDEEFGGESGLELALMLGAEESSLAGEAAPLVGARAKLAGAARQAAELAETLKGHYREGVASPPDQAGLQAALEEIRADLAQAADAFAAVPAASKEALREAASAQFTGIQKADLDIVVTPYALMGGFLILIFILFSVKLPAGGGGEGDRNLHLAATTRRLLGNSRYVGGVVAQTFYVGAQIMCWTFIIQYAESQLGLAKSTAQNCNILAMILFVSSRFVCTLLLHYINAGLLLALLAVGGVVLTAGTIFVQGYAGLYCLIGVSACMSLMFPTIYGIALDGLGDDAKLGSAGLILAIGGGCLMPPLQGAILDMPAFDLGFMELASVRASFALPLICFLVIAVYGVRSIRRRA